MEKGKKATVGGGVQTIGEEGEETMVEVEKGKETNIGRRKGVNGGNGEGCKVEIGRKG